jgi:hypothetical protein
LNSISTDLCELNRGIVIGVRVEGNCAYCSGDLRAILQGLFERDVCGCREKWDREQ